MKAIILAAGEGTRLRPITYFKPKPLIKIDGKTIIEHNLELIYKYVTEIIIVVKYKKEQIIKEVGKTYKNVKITYKEQKGEKGTGGALKGINFDDDVFIVNGDSIFSEIDINNIIEKKGYGVLVKKVASPEKYGIFDTDENNIIKSIVEKPQEYIGDLANLGVYKLNSSIFGYIDKIKLSMRGEYEITDAINMYAKDNDLIAIEAHGDFIDIGYVEDLISKNNAYFSGKFKNPSLGEFFPLDYVGEYILGIGLPKKEIENIIEYSNDKNDTALQIYTSDSKRFATIESLTKWYNDEGRIIFSLVSKDGNIAGFYQIRPSKLPHISQIENPKKVIQIGTKNIHTSGIRLYPNFRGQKLAVPLIKAAHKFYKILHPNACLCIDIETDNIGSQKAFEKLGFEFIGYGENKKSVDKEVEKRMLYIKNL